MNGPPIDDDYLQSLAWLGEMIEPNQGKTRARMVFEWFEDAACDALTVPEKPLIEGLLDESALSVIYGASNSGKTFVVLDMGFTVSVGREWNGRKATRCLVVYVAAEGGAKIRRRIAALRERFKDEISEPPPFVLIRFPIDLRSSDADANELLEKIREAEKICGAKAGWIIIDTLSRALAAGDENSPKDMGAIVRAADRIRAETGAHFTFVHHSGKDEARGARGHSLLRAATDTEIEISKGELAVTKQRDHECDLRLAFTLRDIEIGPDAKSAYIEWSAGTSRRDTGTKTNVPASARLLFQVIGEAINETGQRIKPFHDGPPVFAVQDETVRRRYYAKIAETPRPDETREQLAERQRKAFNRPMKNAIDRKALMAAIIGEQRWIWLPS